MPVVLSSLKWLHRVTVPWGLNLPLQCRLANERGSFMFQDFHKLSAKIWERRILTGKLKAHNQIEIIMLLQA